MPGGATGIGDHFLESFEGKGPNNYHQRDGFSRLKWRGSKKSDHLSKRICSDSDDFPYFKNSSQLSEILSLEGLFCFKLFLDIPWLPAVSSLLLAFGGFCDFSVCCLALVFSFRLFARDADKKGLFQGTFGSWLRWRYRASMER